MKNVKNKKKVSNVMLVIACTMITLYAIADFVLQYFTSVEVSPTLTTAWFTFWGSELFLLAGIKISKVVTNKDDNEVVWEDQDDEILETEDVPEEEVE